MAACPVEFGTQIGLRILGREMPTRHLITVFLYIVFFSIFKNCFVEAGTEMLRYLKLIGRYHLTRM